MDHPGALPLLLRLPPELRDEIYQYVLLKPNNTITILWNPNNEYNTQSFQISAAQPALTRVNKQVRAETLPMFYNSNVFTAEITSAPDLEITRNWLAVIGDKNVHHLRRIRLFGRTKILIGHANCLLSVIATFDLEQGVLSIDGNEAKAEGHRHVMKDMEELRRAFQALVNSRRGKGFDVWSLRLFVKRFYEQM